VAHALTAKWIHHAGGITDGNEIPLNSVVGKRTGHQAILSMQVTWQCTLLYKETRIRLPALDRNRSTITIFEK
jgi:hypothetical protein